MSFILRAAVDGNDRESLCHNLRKLADDVIAQSHHDLEGDNAIGNLGEVGYDFQIDQRREGEVVSIGFPK